MPDEIYVVFTDQTDIRVLRFLRRGFRHCYVLFCFDGLWICVDPLLHKTEVMRLDLPENFTLQQWLEQQGDRVVRVTKTEPEPRILFPMPISCVESIKRILGLQRAAIITPWQLYKYLTRPTGN